MAVNEKVKKRELWGMGVAVVGRYYL